MSSWDMIITVTARTPVFYAPDIITLLLNYGWRLDGEDGTYTIGYIPLNDNNNGNWQFKELTEWNNVYAEITTKAERGEDVILRLYFEDTCVVLTVAGNRTSVKISVDDAYRWRVSALGGLTDWNRYLQAFTVPLPHGRDWISVICEDYP